MNCGDIPWNLGLQLGQEYMVSTSNKSVPEMAIESRFLARKINYKQLGGAPQTL